MELSIQTLPVHSISFLGWFTFFLEAKKPGLKANLYSYSFSFSPSLPPSSLLTSLPPFLLSMCYVSAACMPVVCTCVDAGVHAEVQGQSSTSLHYYLLLSHQTWREAGGNQSPVMLLSMPTRSNLGITSPHKATRSFPHGYWDLNSGP